MARNKIKIEIAGHSNECLLTECLMREMRRIIDEWREEGEHLEISISANVLADKEERQKIVTNSFERFSIRP